MKEIKYHGNDTTGCEESDVGRSGVLPSVSAIGSQTTPEDRIPGETADAPSEKGSRTTGTFAVKANAIRLLDLSRRNARLTIMQRGGSWQDVDDLAQDVIVAALANEKLRDWDPEKLPLPRWAMFLARFECIKRLVRLKRWYHRMQLVDGSGDRRKIEVDESPILQGSASLLLEDLDRHVGSRHGHLGPLLFRLFFVEECTNEDAAKRSGLTIAAASQWRHRLKADVRDYLYGP